MKLFRRNKFLSLFSLLLITSYTALADSTSDEFAIDQFAPVVLEDLEQERGLGGIVEMTINNDTNLDAELTGNSANNVVTGSNVIDSGSFNDASGVFSVIQNTGNNVIIQESTVITVTITPK